MIRVKIFIDKEFIREHQFDQETKELTVGRRPNHPIHLDNSAVSGDHARISIANSVVLEDLKSTNGTLLNGMLIDKPTPLNPSDTIQIAKFRLQIIDERTTRISKNEETTWLACTHPLGKNSGEESPVRKTGYFSYKEFQKYRDENPQ